ncbi:MAG: flippase [Patescibacteria group bacterium]|nr:MAG: flippase [Patescibacteria group bacterium]
MELSARVASNTAIQVIGKILSTLLALAAVALVTRYLGSYGFGQFITALTFVTFFSILADFGLTMVTSQMISKPGADRSKLLGNLFTFRIVTAAVCLGLAPLLVWFFPYDQAVKEGVLIAGVAFFFILLCQPFVSLFQRDLKTDRIAYAETGSRLLLLAFTAGAIYLDWGLSGVLWAMAAANIFSFIFHYFFARSYTSIKWRYDKEIWLDIVKRSWPLIITITLNLIYLRADTLLLSLFRSPDEVGLYGAAYRVIDVLVTVPFILGGTVLPILTARWASGDKQAYIRGWQKTFDASAIIALPMVVGGIVLAGPIMMLLAGDEFVAAGPILKVLMPAAGAVFFSALFSYTMISFDRQKSMIPAYALTAFVALALYLLLIPTYSYTAAAWITLLSEVIILILAWRLIRRYGDIKPNGKIFAKALLASLAMGLFIIILPQIENVILSLVLSIFSGAVVYLLLLYRLGGFKFKDLNFFTKRFSP